MKGKKIILIVTVCVGFVGLLICCSLSSIRVSKTFLNTLEFDGNYYVEHLASDAKVISKADKVVSSTGIGIKKKYRYKVVTVYCSELGENIEISDVPDWDSYEVGEKVTIKRDVFYSESGIRLYYKDTLSHNKDLNAKVVNELLEGYKRRVQLSTFMRKHRYAF